MNSRRWLALGVCLFALGSSTVLLNARESAQKRFFHQLRRSRHLGSGALFFLCKLLGQRFKTGSEVFSSPSVSNGVVYFGSNDGFVYALDATNGDLLWRTNMGGAVLSSPAVLGELLYAGSSDGNLYALNLLGGEVVWTFSVGALVWTSPTVVDDVVYFGSHNDKIYAIERVNE